MIKFFAHDFIYRLHTLEHSQLRAREAIVTKLSTDPDQDFKEQLSDFLEKMRKYLIQLNLEVSLDRLGRFAHLLKGGSFGEDQCSWEVADREITELLNCVLNETGNRHFTFIPSKKVEYFEQEKLFGDEVFNNFESARPEIKNAGNCIAADLNTAAVFHLMRAVEYGMRTLATHVRPRFKLPLDYCDWSGLIRPMEKKLTRIEKQRRGPKKSKQVDFYSRCLSDCKAFIETRNRVSHAREPFSHQEAKALFERVKNFMLLIVNL